LTCIDKYPYKSKFDKRLFIEIDSTILTRTGCSYMISTSFQLADSAIADRGLLHVENDKFYLRFIEPDSKEFVLFDLTESDSASKKIEISFVDGVVSFDCQLQDKVVTDDNLNVWIFRISDLFHNENASLDVVIFVTREYGIIGSYLTDIDYDGMRVLISPAGDILESYIDYSKFEKRKLL